MVIGATPRADAGTAVRADTRLSLLNATVAFALTTLAAVTWHEFGHAFAALSAGGEPTVYPFSVEVTPPLGERAEAWHAAGGPLLSLITGLALIPTQTRARQRGFWGLALTLFTLANLQTFFGYLMTAPFTADGDIGAIITKLGLPGITAWLCFAVGIALTFVTGALFARWLVAYADPALPYLVDYRRLGLLGWTLGSAVMFVLSAGGLGWGRLDPAIVFLCALGAWASHIYVFYGFTFVNRVQTPTRVAQTWSVPWAGLAALVVLAAVRQFVLGPGLTL